MMRISELEVVIQLFHAGRESKVIPSGRGLMTTGDFSITLFCEVVEQMCSMPKHPYASL